MLGAFLGAGVTTVNAVATDWLFWAAAGAIACVTSTQTVAGATLGIAASSATSRRVKGTQARPETTAQSLVSYVFVAIGVLVALTTMSAVDASRSAKASQVVRLQGHSQLAIDSGLRATRSDSLRPEYWHTLGLAYVAADRFGDAAAAFEHASKLAPYDVRYDGDLARAFAVLAQRGDKSSAARAREVAERVIRVDPNNPRAHQTRAVVMQFTGDLPEAVKSIERALTLDPRSGDSQIYLTAAQVFLGTGRPTDAIQVGRRGIQFLPPFETVPIHVEIARALVAIDQAAQALAEVNVALSISPNDANALQLRAQIQQRLAQ
jgi:tetratricopeptide (TPR) repeat protein